MPSVYLLNILLRPLPLVLCINGLDQHTYIVTETGQELGAWAIRRTPSEREDKPDDKLDLNLFLLQKKATALAVTPRQLNEFPNINP
jgi:hypothetical protein